MAKPVSTFYQLGVSLLDGSQQQTSWTWKQKFIEWEQRIAQIATTLVAGIVKPDGTTITIDADGTIHAVGGGVVPTFVDDKVVAGAAFAWTLAHVPSGVPMIFIEIAGFGLVGLVKDSVAAYGYTIAGNEITTVSSFAAGKMRAWYRY